MSNTPQKERLHFIDALRGLAVLLMMEQHIGIWIWRPDHAMMFSNHPVFFTVNGIGGFAGPLFVAIAGISSILFTQRHGNINRILFLRGMMIIAFGYFMNILTPGWFSPGSWFILHMIGFCILITPILLKFPNRSLLIFSGTIIVLTVLIQNYLNTPYNLTSMRMRNTDMPGGILRLILVEGHYPVLPWLSIYLLGLVSGRYFMEKKQKQMLKLALIVFSVGIIALSCYLLKFNFALKGVLARFFRLHVSFFPMTTQFVLLLFPPVIFLLIIFQGLENRYGLSSKNPLVCLGRTSLTLQIVHVVIFFELFQRLNLFRTFNTVETVLLLPAILFTFTVLSVFWKKNNFKFGAEWLMRKITG